VELIAHLGGAIGAIAIQGDYAYVGGEYGFEVLDVSNPQRIVPLHYLPIPVLALQAVPPYAYILDGQIGLRILDLSDPLAPFEIGSYKLPDDTSTFVVADDLAGERRHAYAVSYSQGLFILDVSDPADPFLSAKYKSAADRYYEIVVSNHGSDQLYVLLDTDAMFDDDVAVLDVSSPDMPKRVGTIEGSGGTLAIVDHYLYISQLYEGTTLFDLSDPHVPKRLGTYDYYFSKASIEGDHLYIVRPDDDLGVVDVSDPARPVSVTTSPPFFNDYAFQPEAIATSGQHVYAANNKGLYVVDISDPSAPIQAGFYDTLTASYDLIVKDGYAYLTRADAYNSWNFVGALSTVDLADPTAPLQVGYYEFETPAYSLALAGNHAYVGQGYCSWGSVSCAGELSVLDVSNPATPKEVGHHQSSFSYPSKSGVGTSDWLYTDVCAVDDWVYLTGLPYDAVDHGGLEILHLPDSVTIADTYVFTPGLAADPWSPAAVEIVENDQARYAYLADLQYGLRIVDLAERAHPVEVGSYPISNTRDVAVVGQLAYLLDGINLWIVDISDPTSPQAVHSYPVPGGAWKLAVDGSFAYITNTYDRLQILDISDPLRPRPVGFYITTGTPAGVAVAGGYIYVADGDGGLVILRWR
jgi:hypothetical protein